MRREPPAAALFDMDGVLLDSERLALASVDCAATALGYRLDATQAHRLIGLGRDGGSEVLRSMLGEAFPVARFWDAWYDDYQQRIESGVPVKVGVMSALVALSASGVRLAVATSTETALARRKLERAGLLDYFAAVVGRDAVANGKPAPDAYHTAAERLFAVPSQCWAFEDSLPGLRAATSAGARTHWVPDIARIAAHDLPAEVETIGSLAEVERWLRGGDG